MHIPTANHLQTRPHPANASQITNANGRRADCPQSAAFNQTVTSVQPIGRTTMRGVRDNAPYPANASLITDASRTLVVFSAGTTSVRQQEEKRCPHHCPPPPLFSTSSLAKEHVPELLATAPFAAGAVEHPIFGELLRRVSLWVAFHGQYFTTIFSTSHPLFQPSFRSEPELPGVNTANVFMDSLI